MKKSLIALAALASFAGVASAQSSVTLFGIVDAAVSYGHSNAGSVTKLTNSGYNSSRLGFRGVEDLGGGMSASFWLEAALANDDGQGSNTSANNQPIGTFNPLTGANAPVRSGTQGLTFNRRSTVSLAGGWGEVRLGRDYTPQFWNMTIFDPFGTNGVGTVQIFNSNTAVIPTAVRASNSIGYFLPGNIGGFYGQGMYYMGENASNSTNSGGFNNKKDGTGYGVRFGWANGPFNVAAALSETKYTANLQNPAIAGDMKQNNVGGHWDFGIAKLMGQYEWDQVGSVKSKGWMLGGIMPVGPGEFKASYSEYKFDALVGSSTNKTKKFALGYVHNLSKRTAVYATWAKINNDGGAAQVLNGAPGGLGTLGGTSYGYDFGVRHSF
jgi:predicted porin